MDGVSGEWRAEAGEGEKWKVLEGAMKKAADEVLGRGEATPTRLVLREHWSVGGTYHKAEHSVCNVAQNTLPT